MLDIKYIRENKEELIENLKKREGFDLSIVDRVLELDNSWREIKKELDSLKSKKNKESQNISKIKKEGGDFKAQIKKVKEISDTILEKEEVEKELLRKRNSELIKIPNLLDPEVPIGNDDEDNVPIKYHLEKPKFSFKPRSHREICQLNDWYDLEKASIVSGSRFYYTKGDLVLLELALYSFVIDKLIKKGYIPVTTPPMLRREFLGKSVPLESFEEDIYKIENEDLYLIATSEHTLAVIHDNEVINPNKLPIKYAGISPCYRKEAGVTKDSKGIFRVHNFNKIEQFVYCRPEDSDKIHKEILENAEEIFRDLEIHYRVVDICSGDMGAMATRKFDIEAWLPSQEKYREMVSASNYRDYGARRLNTKFQNEEGGLSLVHTLNSTAIAHTRCMISIIEQHQQEDGRVKIPEKLRKYLGGREYLG